MKKNSLPPKIIYGTAWKEDRTTHLVNQAIQLGYRALDTANQMKHYREDFAGEAFQNIQSQGLSRDDFFIQSKYTFPAGQDYRMPYDPKTPYAQQVADSFQSTLDHFQTDYLDAYLLHGPIHPRGLTEPDWEVWNAMETLEKNGRVHRLGVSNVSIEHLEALCTKARIKPEIVQNRCYAARGWDLEVRDYCRKNDIIYEGFSLLTANPRVVRHAHVQAIALRRKVTPEQVVLRFASQIGILPLTGTTDGLHMRQDLDIFKFELSVPEVEEILNLRI